MMTKLDKAFKAIPRINFLPPSQRSRSELDVPLPIGYRQTNSQPSTVRQMLHWLNPQTGDKVLDVGSGSGWTSALLAYLIGVTGTVYAVEKISQLVLFGEDNCRKLDLHNVLFFAASDSYGLPNLAPFDRILVSASATELPKTLLAQLKIGGRMVIPVKNSIFVIDKVSDDSYKTKEYPGYIFVPLI